MQGVTRWISLIVASGLACASAANLSRPNVVLIYGDDVGYADVGVNGATQIDTPNIDQLAAGGLNFTDGHSSASTCTPSRYSLLTGVQAFRHNVRIAPPNEPLLIDPDAMTLPRLFKQAGYSTGIVGKWHLGLGDKDTGPNWNGALKPGPLELGFDSAFLLPTTNDRVPCVYVDGHHVVNLDPNDPIYVGDTLADVQIAGSTQYPDARKDSNEVFYKSIVNGIGRIGYMSGGQSALWDDYTSTDVFVGKACEFITEHRDQPFFLIYSAQDIHIPNAPNQRFKGATKLGSRGDAMVQLDWAVGAILEELERYGLSENTIVIFTSDNGPTHHDDSYPSTEKVELYSPKSGNGHDASGPWRGGKYEIYEGSTRVPLVIRWPAQIQAGTSQATVNQIDFMASFANFLNVELSADEGRDSRDALAALLGEDATGSELLIEEGRGVALRMGDWKFIPAMAPKYARGFWPLEDCLYDLSKDVGEQNNLILQYPEKAQSMSLRLKELKSSKSIRAYSQTH
ncbi:MULTISPECIES: arylsulfatase [unclassified Lentimonas]|uniref:sulfatase family protein n=1 Tax=unclassified Lentimonas TaxID=2630993 RepID=UPI00132BB538|nr:MULTISPECIES: arylsulfatase [unclassified Lentimonas]CAA6690689.1 Choline-sulfatase (EC [Lentimonas sp. CC19]CAA6693378.1 Choline-sulfatase (EC [Lentimonas sp. CC10]CAA7071847.1 Choline-sulfatase (EC [Lentimonas sp. CC11]